MVWGMRLAGGVVALVVLVMVVVALLVLLTAWQRRAVSRRRLERFALREALSVTAENGNRVLAYLAVTRRWRAVGLLAGIGVVTYRQWWLSRSGDGSASAFPDQGPFYLAAFAGWFVGAVVAEWRVATVDRATVNRSASLQPRRLRDFLSRWLLAIPLVVWGALACLAVAGLVRVADGSAPRPALFVVASLGAVGCGLALYVVVRRVVGRPQPAIPEDLVAADNALRRRSLRVLFGATIAIAGYLGIALADAVSWRMSTDTPERGVVSTVCLFVLPAVGVLFAVAPRRVVAWRQVAAAR